MSTLQQRRATTPATNNLPEDASPEATTTTTTATGAGAGAGAGDFYATRRARRKVKSRSSNSQRGTVSWSIFVAIAGMAAIWVLIPICLIKFGYLTLPSEHPFVRHRASAPDGIVAIQDSVVDTISPRDSDVTKEKQKSQKALPNYRKLETEVIDMRVMAATLPFDDKDGGVWKQGWDLDPKKPSPDSPLKVFVVPHSHCDPGWIKTFDDYFRTQTSGIISSVVQALVKDSRRKFIWAEISYFEWWWNDQSESQRAVVKKLLRNGQLEFVTGGWVQPDEANTELYAMEIQLQEGHDWIRQTLGEEFIPKYGWSIDPFGYSPTMAYLLQKYGFEGMLIQRVHYAVKKELASKKQLEFLWRYVLSHFIFPCRLWSSLIIHFGNWQLTICACFFFLNGCRFGRFWHVPDKPGTKLANTISLPISCHSIPMTSHIRAVQIHLYVVNLISLARFRCMDDVHGTSIRKR